MEVVHSGNQPAIFMDSGFSFDSSSEVAGVEAMALEVGGGRAMGTGRSSSSLTGRELQIVELQRKRDGGDYFLGVTDDSIGQQHCTAVRALRHTLSSNKASHFHGQRFLVRRFVGSALQGD